MQCGSDFFLRSLCRFVMIARAFAEQFADTVLSYLEGKLSEVRNSFFAYVGQGSAVLDTISKVVDVVATIPSLDFISDNVRTAIQKARDVRRSARCDQAISLSQPLQALTIVHLRFLCDVRLR